MTNKWRLAARAVAMNAERLADAADWLGEAHSGPSFALAIIAQEEAAKAFLCHLISQGAVPESKFVLRATRDHACKHLLGMVMEYMNPDDFLTSIGPVFEDRAANRFRRDIADALNILRHEKLGRWESRNQVWADEPEYDATAKRVAEGALDREKQDGLYVGIGRDGTVSSSPGSVSWDAARDAIGRAHRFVRLCKQLENNDTRGLLDYGRISSAFAALFQSLKVEK